MKMTFAVAGGSVSLIQGSYEYYHYLQDGFDDSVINFSVQVDIILSFSNTMWHILIN